MFGLHYEHGWEEYEMNAWRKLSEVEVLWTPGTMPWRSLAVIGFPNYICYEDGKLYEVFPERVGTEAPVMVRKKIYYQGAQRRGTYILQKQVRGQYNKLVEIKKRIKMHILVATLFVPRPEGSFRVGFIDGDQYHVHAKNLYWN